MFSSPLWSDTYHEGTSRAGEVRGQLDGYGVRPFLRYHSQVKHLSSGFPAYLHWYSKILKAHEINIRYEQDNQKVKYERNI